MPVCVNFKICDNSPECGGIAECSTGALSWDDVNKTIIVDNEKCISCGKCEEACPVGAIKVASSEEEYDKLKQEIDEDPRQIADLYLDRYGAQPILPAFLIKADEFQQSVVASTIPAVAELFEPDSIMCMLRSIPIKDLFAGVNIKYQKVEINDKLRGKYNIVNLPALLFFADGKQLGKIEGYIDLEHKDKLQAKIDKIIRK